MLASRLFPAEIEFLPNLVAFLEAALEESGAGPKEIFDIELAADEIFTNIASYAYGKEKGEVEVTITSDEHSIIISLIDSGAPFNPLSLPSPDTTLGIDDRKIGGLGIHLVRKLMDNVTYMQENGRNILTLEKKRGKRR